MQKILNVGRTYLQREFVQYTATVCPLGIRTLSKIHKMTPPIAGEEEHMKKLTQTHLSVLGVPNRIRPDPAFKKINTPEFRNIFTEELQTLIGLFKKYGFEIRIAGGAVRDLLMDIQPKDIDLATTATPEQMKEMFTREEIRMINTNGERHGTVTPRINNSENFEVTTLRIDVRTDGRHAEVQFTTDWQLDANRRDLTINSMFLGFDGTLYDYFYGYDDLMERRVVFVGDPAVRIKEDYLRILRYFRFYGRISCDANRHDENTLQAIRQNAEGLQRISGERIWSELQKIVVGNFGCELVEEMIKCGLATYCGLPKDANLTEFRRLHADLKRFPKPHTAISYLIALLRTCTDAMVLHERLKLSAFERDLALFITQQRTKVDSEFITLLDYQKLCMQAFAKRAFVEELLKYANKLEIYNSLKSWQMPTFPLNGNQLRDLGCPKDKRMGVIMLELKTIWADSGFRLSGNELIDKYYPIALEKCSKKPDEPIKKMRKKDKE